jgi:UDP-GlcNAc:undecaprenyl-phosphate/decaprenyl-phosphate GlcNAc-1-phosphate transferase
LLDEGRFLGAVLLPLAAVWAVTPGAIRLAVRTSFYDHPVGYKGHARPTPYLGGAAVVAGFVLGALVFGQDVARFAPILICAVALGVVGTIDDRIALRPLYRVVAEIAAAGVLTVTESGWTFLASPFEQFLLNSVWIVGFTNAFNLMDNMDGAASTVGAVCAAGIAALGFIEHDYGLAIFSLTLCGACVGFLRYNLRPGGSARIFLGDGGSLPLGFTIAAAAAQIPGGEALGWPALLAGGLLLGILVLDTLLVVVSRTRRGVSMVTAGRDHLTHRLQVKLGAPVIVAVALGITQAAVSLLAIVALQVGRTPIIASATSCLVLAAGIIAILDRPGWLVGDSADVGLGTERVQHAESAT